MIKVALPKGRIAEQTLAIFSKIYKNDFIFEDRKLILKKDDFEFLLVRSQDVPTYVFHGGADLGVVGLDVLEEKEYDILKLLDLGIGKCRVSVAMPNGSVLNTDIPEIKIATKMVNITSKHFAKKAMAAQIIKLYGSIELAPLVGLADAIVDVVETGTTLKQNGLREVETIFESSAYLIANKNSFYSSKLKILSLISLIKSYL